MSVLCQKEESSNVQHHQDLLGHQQKQYPSPSSNVDHDAAYPNSKQAKNKTTVARQKDLNHDIDLDKIKNEFRDVDFHPMQPEPPDKFMYAVHYENL